MNKQMMQKV